MFTVYVGKDVHNEVVKAVLSQGNNALKLDGNF